MIGGTGGLCRDDGKGGLCAAAGGDADGVAGVGGQTCEVDICGGGQALVNPVGVAVGHVFHSPGGLGVAGCPADAYLGGVDMGDYHRGRCAVARGLASEGVELDVGTEGCSVAAGDGGDVVASAVGVAMAGHDAVSIVAAEGVGRAVVVVGVVVNNKEQVGGTVVVERGIELEVVPASAGGVGTGVHGTYIDALECRAVGYVPGGEVLHGGVGHIDGAVRLDSGGSGTVIAEVDAGDDSTTMHFVAGVELLCI